MYKSIWSALLLSALAATEVFAADKPNILVIWATTLAHGTSATTTAA